MTEEKRKDKRSVIRRFRRIRMSPSSVMPANAHRSLKRRQRLVKDLCTDLTLARDFVQHTIERRAVEQPPAQDHAVDAANVRDIRQRIGRQ